MGRTYQKIRSNFHCRGSYRSVQRYVGESVDSVTEKKRPIFRGESSGNVEATYPLQVIAMDHILHYYDHLKGIQSDCCNLIFFWIYDHEGEFVQSCADDCRDL